MELAKNYTPVRLRLPNMYCIDDKGCWLFTGYKDKLGYGIVSYLGYANKAHRVAWTIWRGDIPKGLNVLHKCDVRCCINPGHLFLGNQLDNTLDMIAKGRKPSVKGVNHPCNKLSEEEIYQIRLLLVEGILRQREIAKLFNVTEQNIYRIKTRKTWSHLK